MTERNENLDDMFRVGGVVKCPIKCAAIAPNRRDLFEKMAYIMFVCELKNKKKKLGLYFYFILCANRETFLCLPPNRSALCGKCRYFSGHIMFTIMYEFLTETNESTDDVIY